MMISNRIACAVIAGLAMPFGGCAAAVGPEMSSLFVKHGEPSISYDAPEAGTRKTKRPKADPPPPEMAMGPRVLNESGATVENTDVRLSEALKALRLANTVSNQLRAAGEYRRLRILDKAHEHATAALKLNRRSSDALQLRAQIWRESGFPHLGLNDASRAVFVAPTSPSAENTLGTLLQSLGQTDAARQAFERVIALDPSAAYAWSNLCYLSLVTGKPDRAVGECDTALRLAPELLAARNNIALSYAVAGKVDEARAELLAGGSPADAAFNLGMLYLALGRYQLAEESFERAAGMRPNFSAAEMRREQAARLAAARPNAYDHSHRP